LDVAPAQEVEALQVLVHGLELIDHLPNLLDLANRLQDVLDQIRDINDGPLGLGWRCWDRCEEQDSDEDSGRSACEKSHAGLQI